MKMIISYNNKNGDKKHAEYSGIEQFLLAIESNSIDNPTLDDCNVKISFFFPGQYEYTASYHTIRDLYEDCKRKIREKALIRAISCDTNINIKHFLGHDFNENTENPYLNICGLVAHMSEKELKYWEEKYSLISTDNDKEDSLSTEEERE